MFAFKILNLRHCSEKLISSLCFLSLGLLFLIFASKGYFPLPIPSLPFTVTVLIFSVNYAIYGNTFIEFYKKRKKENLFSLAFLSLSYVISLFLPVMLLRYKLFFFSLILSLISSYLLFFVFRKAASYKDIFFNLVFHFIVNLYMLYLSLSLFF